ncbi:CPBP family intramembrane metalloprotease [Shimazuella sp. AN120528]|uniref:CPBP family intramembrane glutamic endopeptidase n=1 Tax=Shimazuella soli TaxID=1892854 RepID=UPI001F0F3E33|nr:CPBP family intramembrane glutamic endopeptidase [Shimazuella soli]MCH5584764.1 CPBP family intramembrane metalloprotease [Shimazuella soli]
MRKLSNEIWIYMIFTLGLTTLCLLSSNNLIKAISQGTPMLVAIGVVLFARRKGKWKELGMARLGTGKGYLLVLLVVAVVIISFSIAWMMGVVQLPVITKINMTQWERFVFLVKLYVQVGIILGPILFALGEEIGWRGYLQTRLLHEVGANKAIWITAGCWAVFHYPFLFLADYTDSGNIWINTLLFTIMIFPLSFLLGWIRISSQSIWPVVLCHGLINYFRGFLDTLFYVKKPHWTYVTGENGIITILAWTILAVIVYQFAMQKNKVL